MTVYLDVLFLINFIMDYFVISLSGVMAATKIGPGKRLIASLLGAIMGVMHFILAKTAALSFLFGAAVPPLVVLAALYPCGKKLFSRCLLCYTASAFILSGAVSFITNILGIEGSRLASPMLYFTSGLIFLLAKNIHKMLKSGALKGEYKITVSYNGYSVTRNARLDTGNSLTDPVSKSPVIVADGEILSELFAPGCNEMNIIEWIAPSDLRIIPYKTIDRTGVMTGFVPTAVTVNGRPVPDAVIAISSRKITDGVLLNSAVI